MFRESSPPLEKTEVVFLSIAALLPSNNALRTVGVNAGLDELAASIAASGIIHPLLVRPAEASTDRFEIIAGNRRYRAAQIVGLSQVPCIIHATDPQQAFLFSLIENLQRDNLHPLDEAWAYDRLIEMGIARNRADIARRLGLSRARITQKMQLLELDDRTKQKLIEYSSKLSETHARLLLQVKNLDARHHLACISGEKGLSGQELREAIRALEENADLLRWQAKPEAGLSQRKYQISARGFHLSISFGQVDTRYAYETLQRLMAQLEGQLAESSAPARPAAASPQASRPKLPWVKARLGLLKSLRQIADSVIQEHFGQSNG